MRYELLPRRSLGFFPTPLMKLSRLTERLSGPRLFMKRDDQTGLALGGNKTRKLEFLVGEALAHGCDTLITGGAAQSNHCRQTAAAAAACGLACHLVLGGEAPSVPEGNLLLDQLLGAVTHWTGEFRRGERIPEIAESLRSAGRKPYVVPYGGSNTTGAAGFVEAVRELADQLSQLGESITHIVFASSSGGTQAGLTVGKSLFGLNCELIGIGIDKGASPPSAQRAAARRGERFRLPSISCGWPTRPRSVLVSTIAFRPQSLLSEMIIWGRAMAW
jgi:1-aminocyclopropane-1-carboxylate deaminase/D-cysteine desulfhydrase-like pyridoxal-dependent ACC family enzyme